MKRLLCLFLLLGASLARAATVTWPLDQRTLGEITDLVRHLNVTAPSAGIDGEPLLSGGDLERFYSARDYRPAWVGRDGVNLETADILERLRLAGLEGVGAHDYHVAAIQARLAKGADDLLPLAQLDLLLSDAFLGFSRDVREGRLDPHRLDPDWHLSRFSSDYPALLQQALAQQAVLAAMDAMAPDNEGYRRLRMALVRYRAVERRGGWPAIPLGRPLLRKGVRDPRVPALRWRLVAGGELRDEAVADDELFDGAMEKAVRHFQRRFGLDADGLAGDGTLMAMNVPVSERIRQIELNMERWRWLPHHWPDRYAVVNLAGFELALVEKQFAVQEMRVIVGRDERPTPLMQSRIDTLVLNPYWYVPETVLRKDLLPALHRDAGLLQRKHLKVFSSLKGNGQEVDPARIDWKRYADAPFPYTLRQDPGPENALGRLKFLITDSPGIYLHDTPNHGLFRGDARALSSGCIRLSEPEALAEYLLKPQGWDAARIKEVIESGRPTQVELAEPLPVFLVYFTAWVNELNELNFRDDVYGRDARLAEALAAVR